MSEEQVKKRGRPVIYPDAKARRREYMREWRKKQKEKNDRPRDREVG